MIGMILAIVDLQITPIFLSNFGSIGLSVQEKKFKVDFKMVAMAATFYLQVARIRPTKFRVNWPFRPGEVQNRF